MGKINKANMKKKKTVNINKSINQVLDIVSTTSKAINVGKSLQKALYR